MKAKKVDPKVPEYIQRLIPYVPGKPIEETQREFKIRRVVKLASNENPLGPSPKAIRAVRDSLMDQHRYPDASAFSLKRALARHLNVEPASVIVGNGSNEVIDFLIRTFCVTGDAIVTSKAAFVAYRICAQIHGVQTLESPLTEDLRFDLKAMGDLIERDRQARIAFIANPNNPTGTYLTTDEMETFLKRVSRISKVQGRSVLVVLDYAYWEYVSAKDLPDAMELMRRYPNVIVLRTFSKIYGLAGLRAGYGVAAPELIAHLEKVRQPFNVNVPALVGAEAALADKTFVAQARKLNRQEMKFWERELKSMGIPFWKSQGNFLLVDVQQGLGMSGSEVYQACLRRGVIFRPVNNYGLPHALRISVGTHEENRIAVEALRSLSKSRSEPRSKSLKK